VYSVSVGFREPFETSLCVCSHVFVESSEAIHTCNLYAWRPKLRWKMVG